MFRNSAQNLAILNTPRSESIKAGEVVVVEVGGGGGVERLWEPIDKQNGKCIPPVYPDNTLSVFSYSIRKASVR